MKIVCIVYALMGRRQPVRAWRLLRPGRPVVARFGDDFRQPSRRLRDYPILLAARRRIVVTIFVEYRRCGYTSYYKQIYCIVTITRRLQESRRAYMSTGLFVGFFNLPTVAGVYEIRE